MRRSISIATSVAAAAVVTHGVVFSAANFNEPLPISTYQGLFQQIMLTTERLWSFAHGWQPMSHIQVFGRFYAPTVELICPLLGFALFCLLSRHKVGANLWKPMGIALLLTILSRLVPEVSQYSLPWSEVARTVLVLLLMIWSVGAIPVSMWPVGSRQFPEDLTRRRAPASL